MSLSLLVYRHLICIQPRVLPMDKGVPCDPFTDARRWCDYSDSSGVPDYTVNIACIESRLILRLASRGGVNASLRLLWLHSPAYHGIPRALKGIND